MALPIEGLYSPISAGKSIENVGPELRLKGGRDTCRRDRNNHLEAETNQNQDQGHEKQGSKCGVEVQRAQVDVGSMGPIHHGRCSLGDDCEESGLGEA